MTESDRDQQYSQFVQMFVRHEAAVRGFVRSLLPSWADTDDVMQEVSLACWKKFDQFESGDEAGEFLRWTCMIGRFEVLRHRRRFARDRLVLSEDVIQLLAADAESRLDLASKERQAVEQCLQKLNAAERRLLLSVHTPGDWIARIADEMNEKSRRLYTKLNFLRDQIAQCVRQRVAGAEA